MASWSCSNILIREDGNWRVATGDNATIITFSQEQSSFRAALPN